jgi:hypothetical protein
MSPEAHSNKERTAQKAKKAILGVLLVYALTVATHLGEFWPFSIYPMFSQAGNPWSRSLVREVPQDDSTAWQTVPLDSLPGQPYGVASGGVDAIDLANFVSKTREWDLDRVAALKLMLLADPPRTPLDLVVFRVRARLTEADSVAILATPYVRVGTDRTPSAADVNPEIRP